MRQEGQMWRPRIRSVRSIRTWCSVAVLFAASSAAFAVCNGYGVPNSTDPPEQVGDQYWICQHFCVRRVATDSVSISTALTSEQVSGTPPDGEYTPNNPTKDSDTGVTGPDEAGLYLRVECYHYCNFFDPGETQT